MISHEPLWETMKRKSATTYTLRNKGKPYCVSGSTIEQMKKNRPISTTALDAICKILGCEISDIIKFVLD